MKTLGVYTGHDMGVAVVDSGRVTLALEEERPSRVKHADPAPFSYPKLSLDWLRDAEGVTPQNVDRVAAADPNPGPEYIPKTLGCATPLTFEHHLCHAATAYYWSGWDDCFVLVIDGGGCTNYRRLFRAHDGVLEPIAAEPMRGPGAGDETPGSFYWRMTQALGFKPLTGEGKVQAGAAHGNADRFYEKLGGRYDIQPMKVSLRPGFSWAHPDAHLVERDVCHCDPKDMSVRADLSAATQRIFEEMIWADVKAFIPKGAKLALAGGCFANVTINRRLLDWASEIFVSPPMNDSGVATGAAMLAAAAAGEMKPHRLEHVFFGYDAGAIPDTVDPKVVAQMIADGASVAVCQGRCEHGPRALGHRSLLADPRRSEMAVKLNRANGRDSIMPYAPSCLASEADSLLEPAWRRAAHAAEFMTIAFAANEVWKDRMPAVVHKDGTCRPQLIRPDVDPNGNFFFDVLTAFFKLTGVPALLQTSLNPHGPPISYDYGDARKMLDRGCMDVLVSCNGIEKRE